MEHRSQPTDWVATRLSKNREKKAKKIEKLVSKAIGHQLTAGSMLDFGCGNGLISRYFADRGLKVDAVDVVEYGTIAHSGVTFTKIRPHQRLPFEDEKFDIIVSNMVMPSVQDKKLYLEECYRLLKPTGVVYLASINSNFPIDLYYQIPLIHYLGHHAYMGIIKKIGLLSDQIWPNSYGFFTKTFRNIGFSYQDYSAHVLSHPEEFYLDSHLSKYIPEFLIKPFQAFFPVNIFVLKK